MRTQSLSRLPKSQSLLLTCLFFLYCVAADSNLRAQRPSSPRQSLAVDEVALTTGKRMYGIVLQGDAKQGVTLVVERNWFKKTYPKQYAAHHKSELASAKTFCAAQLERLEQWKKHRADDVDLVEFIDEEIARTKAQQDDAANAGLRELKPFTLIAYPATDIKDVYVQPAIRHQIAGCAWKHDVKRVTTRTFSALQRALERKKVDPHNETVDLSSQIPARQRQSETEWQARVALFEYVLRKKLDFQGMGSSLLRVDADKLPNPQDLWQQMLSGGLGLGEGRPGGGGLVDELLKELNLEGGGRKNTRLDTKWWEAATKAAESEGIRGLRITRVVQDFSSPLAKVENYFFAQIKPGAWKQIIRVSATANRNQVDPGDLERIKTDPQVKKVLTMFSGLGISSDELIETAIRQGAATDVAMKDSAQKFFELVDRYTEHTDGPPLRLTARRN